MGAKCSGDLPLLQAKLGRRKVKNYEQSTRTPHNGYSSLRICPCACAEQSRLCGGMHGSTGMRRAVIGALQLRSAGRWWFAGDRCRRLHNRARLLVPLLPHLLDVRHTKQLRCVHLGQNNHGRWPSSADQQARSEFHSNEHAVRRRGCAMSCYRWRGCMVKQYWPGDRSRRATTSMLV